MRLKEYEGKEIFKKYKINIPKGIIINSLTNLNKPLIKKFIKSIKTKKIVVKAEVMVGSRKKYGGIFICKKEELQKCCKDLFKREVRGFKVKEILIEEYTNIKQEYYLSLTINKDKACLEILFSRKGGIDIEKLSKDHPSEIKKIYLKDINTITTIDLIKLDTKLLRIHHKKEIIQLIKKLHKIMICYDTELVEINPLALTDKGLIALDSKIIIDENSLYRHKDLANSKIHRMTELEKKAYFNDLHYVDLEGDIGIIGNGAGLVMSTIDMINYYKGKAANFLDAPGGTSKEAMKKSLEIVLKKKGIKGLLINIFGGITKCDKVAEAIIEYNKKNKIKIPIVARIIGTNEKIARKMLKTKKFAVYKEMDKAVKAIIKKTNQGKIR